MRIKKENKNKIKDKRAQLTIFIIIAILIVIVGSSFYYFTRTHVPTEFKPIEGTFKQCISDNAKIGLETLGLQAGYINMPNQQFFGEFTNIVDFSGIKMPFWFYIPVPGIMKKQIPTAASIENDLNKYIKQNIDECINITEQKYESIKITKSDKQADVSTSIYNDHVDINVKYRLLITKDNKNVVIQDHKVNVRSKFGQLYSDALELVNYELRDMLLENYTIDVLRLYLPVDGLRLTCKPVVWNEQQLTSNFQRALINLQYIKLSTAYKPKTQTGKSERYFDAPLKVSSNVNLVPLTATLKAYPSENGTIRFDPVGNQPGLNNIFCYTPYHIVYDINIPIMVQLSLGNEILQFPIMITIDHNQPRENKINNETKTVNESEICNHKINSLHVETYYGNEAINASIYVKCINVNCYVGKTENGVLETKAPSCINAMIKAIVNGFSTSSIFINTNNNLSITFYLDKLYNESIKINTENDEDAIIYFSSNDFSRVVYYPTQKEVTLKPGHYNISVQVFGKSNINVPNTDTCVNINGVKQCFNIQSEGQIGDVIIGGGKKDMWINEQDLKQGRINLQIKRYKKPATVEEIEQIIQLVENSQLSIEFK